MRALESNRLEAFSDGVLAIIIRIMVLELQIPHGSSLVCSLIAVEGESSRLREAGQVALEPAVRDQPHQRHHGVAGRAGHGLTKASRIPVT